MLVFQSPRGVGVVQTLIKGYNDKCLEMGFNHLAV